MFRIPMFTLIAGTFVTSGGAVIAEAQTGIQETKTNRWEASAERRIKMTIEATQGTKYCHSTTSIEYQQRGNLALVNGEITVEDCTVARGKYTLSLRLKDDSGEIQNLNFEDTWQRSDDAPVSFAREYSIGDNVDLIRVRARRTQCICEDADAKPEHAE